MRKRITMDETITIGGVNVVELNASISQSEEGQAYTNISIYDKNLYAKNAKECREKIQAFLEAVWKAEDEVYAKK